MQSASMQPASMPYISNVGNYNQLPQPSLSIPVQEYNKLLYSEQPLKSELREIGCNATNPGIKAFITYFSTFALASLANGTFVKIGCNHQWETVGVQGPFRVDLCRCCGSEREYSID